MIYKYYEDEDFAEQSMATSPGPLSLMPTKGLGYTKGAQPISGQQPRRPADSGRRTANAAGQTDDYREGVNAFLENANRYSREISISSHPPACFRSRFSTVLFSGTLFTANPQVTP